MQALKDFSKQILLKNGDQVLLRAIKADDKERLLEGFYRLTGRSISFYLSVKTILL